MEAVMMDCAVVAAVVCDNTGGCDHCLARDEHVLIGQITPVLYQK